MRTQVALRQLVFRKFGPGSQELNGARKPTHVGFRTHHCNSPNRYQPTTPSLSPILQLHPVMTIAKEIQFTKPYVNTELFILQARIFSSPQGRWRDDHGVHYLCTRPILKILERLSWLTTACWLFEIALIEKSATATNC